MNGALLLDHLDPQLLRCASIGTARAAAPEFATAAEDSAALTMLLAEIRSSAPSAAVAVLRMAALCHSARLAGHQPAAAAPPEVDAAPAETRNLLEPGLTRALIQTLSDGHTRLQIELLAQVNVAQRRLHPSLLPSLLDAGRRHGALREAVRVLGGERARWLAQWNSDWSYATGVGESVDPEARWLHGNLEERVSTLRQWREADPDAARARLAAVLPSLPARERAELLTTLALHPLPADLELLQSCLADRSREVVDRALSLLMLHPDNPHERRASARLAQFVSSFGAIEPPEASQLLPDWKSDGIELKRPKNEALGERAWWLYQLARQVPPSWWSEHWQNNAAQVLKRIVQSEWRDALLRAVQESTQASGDLGFVEALLGVLPPAQHPSLLARLPLTARERWWSARVVKQAKDFAALAAEICAACAPGEYLGADLAQTLVQNVVRLLSAEKLQYQYELRYQLPELLCVLPLAQLEPIAELANRHDPEVLSNDWWGKLARIIEVRQRFAELASAIPAMPPDDQCRVRLD